jgi:hypothetical protein
MLLGSMSRFSQFQSQRHGSRDRMPLCAPEKAPGPARRWTTGYCRRQKPGGGLCWWPAYRGIFHIAGDAALDAVAGAAGFGCCDLPALNPRHSPASRMGGSSKALAGAVRSTPELHTSASLRYSSLHSGQAPTPSSLSPTSYAGIVLSSGTWKKNWRQFSDSWRGLACRYAWVRLRGRPFFRASASWNSDRWWTRRD